MSIKINTKALGKAAFYALVKNRAYGAQQWGRIPLQPPISEEMRAVSIMAYSTVWYATRCQCQDFYCLQKESISVINME